MIDFIITLQVDELLYEEYEKVSPISEIVFNKFLRQFKAKTALPPKFKDSVLPRNLLAIMDLLFDV